jgi:hypothetical protein
MNMHSITQRTCSLGKSRRLAVLTGFTAIVLASTYGFNARTFSQEVLTEASDSGILRQQCEAWCESAHASSSLKEQVLDLWPEDEPSPPSGRLLFERMVGTAALLDAPTAALTAACDDLTAWTVPPSFENIESGSLPAPLIANLRLHYARRLMHDRFYDESLEQLEQLQPDDVDAPTLHFCRAIVYQRLLDQEHGLEAVEAILADRDSAPARYVAVAELLKQELLALSPDSLDHIARRMEDVERRLDHGRADDDVRNLEEGIVESLDQLIEKLTEQQQDQSSSGRSDNIEVGQPAQESQAMGGQGQGTTDDHSLSDLREWGALPPREQEAATREMTQGLPAHYQDVIEQFYRQLANEEEN